MNIPHILTEIINKPLMITPDKLSVILGILNRKAGGGLDVDLSSVIGASQGTPQAETARPANRTEQTQIAVISIIGSLVSRNRGFSDGSGLRSYRTLQFEMEQAMADPEVGGIILDIDTYGGMVAGLDRFAGFVRRAAQEKPVYAVVDLNCYSAGYYIASACSKVILTDPLTAGIGSIGCILIHADISQYNDRKGYSYSVFYFGARKNDFSPLAPLTEEMKKVLDSDVRQHGMKFAERVADFRGLPLETVLKTEAGCYCGRAAIDIGLADEIATFDEAVAMMAAEIEQRKQTGVTAMTTKERLAALIENNNDATAALADLGFIPKGAEQAEENAGGGEAAATEERERIFSVLRLGGFDSETPLARMALDPSFTREKAALKMIEDGIAPAGGDKKDRQRAAAALAEDAVEIPLVDSDSGAAAGVDTQEQAMAIENILAGAKQVLH